MKETFIPKNFNADATATLAAIYPILEKYEGLGFDLTLRQVYYQLVASDFIANNEREYKNLGNLINDARLAGLIDWDQLVDRGRSSHKPYAWDNPKQILESSAAGWHSDPWDNQPYYIEVMVEKQALEGILSPVCSELDVTFGANKGYTSASQLYRVGKRFMRQRRNGKQCVAIYLGDHDPSGMDMTRDVQDRIEMFSRGPVDVRRIALNMDQIRELNPPENPTKLTDSRATKYIAAYGESCWELDAIEPTALADLVRDEVLSLRDEAIHADWVESEENIKGKLSDFVEGWDKPVDEPISHDLDEIELLEKLLIRQLKGKRVPSKVRRLNERAQRTLKMMADDIEGKFKV